MKRALNFAAAVGLVTTSIPAGAANNLIAQPVQTNGENIRYQHGAAAIDIVTDTGSVQIRPAPMDHGSLAFNIAVFNNGNVPSNIDVANFTLTSGNTTVQAFTVETLTKKAKNRAAWSTFAVALAGGLSAAAAASQRDYYHSTLVTPRGTYRSYFSAPSVAGQMQATAIAAGTGVGIYAIQNQLDKTLEGLGEQIVQLTTVDPGDSYAGKIIFEKVALAAAPARVTMTVDWNGHKYPFTFQIAKPGTPAPPFTPVAVPVPVPVSAPAAPSAPQTPATANSPTQTPSPASPVTPSSPAISIETNKTT